MIRLPAVALRPTVATNAAMPITMPSTVKAMRVGRASIPAIASARRSRAVIPDCDTPAMGEVRRARLASRDGAGSFPGEVELQHDWRSLGRSLDRSLDRSLG